MNCKLAESRLSAYLDRELSGVEMLQVRRHLHQCPACAAQERSILALKQAMGQTESAVPAPDFEARLFAKLKEVAAEPTPAAQQRDWKVAVGFVSAACLALAVTTLYLRLHATPAGPPPGAADQANKQSMALNLEMRRDQMYQSTSDPFSGPSGVTPVSYGNR